jgi:manganese transport protein
MAFFVNAAILILAAAAFHKNGHFEIAEIQDAHQLLQTIFGSLAPTLFALALIAAGQSSTITGTLAGQIIMEGHINLRIRPWLRRMITRLLAIIPALFTIIYFGEQALGSLLILSQVVLSLQLGFAIIPLIHFNSDKNQMKEFVIKPWVKILAWASALIVVILNVRLVTEEISGWIIGSGDNTWWIYVIVIPLAIALGLLLLYVFFSPFLSKRRQSLIKVPHGKALEILNVEDIRYRQVGITIDFSKNDVNTIRHGLVQGGKEAKYYLIHIVETAAARYHGQEVLDFETQSDAQNLEEYRLNLERLGYHAKIVIGYGATAKSIAKAVADSNIDLLVMGAHGHKGIMDWLHGETINEVRHRIKIPVLVVDL